MRPTEIRNGACAQIPRPNRGGDGTLIWAIFAATLGVETAEPRSLAEVAAILAKGLTPELQSVVVPDREPSALVLDDCVLEIYPHTTAGYIQRIDLSGAQLGEDGYVWYGDTAIGNAVIVFETLSIGNIRWRKPGQDSSPFPYAVYQTARYVKKPDVDALVGAIQAAFARCLEP